MAVAVEGDAGIYASVHYVLDLLEENGNSRKSNFPVFLHSSLRKRPQTTSHQPKRKTGHYSGQYYFGRTGHVSEPSSCAGYHEIISMCRHSTGLHGVPPQYSYHYFENISTAEEYHSSHQAELKRRVFPYFSLMIIFNEQTRKDDSAK